MADEETPIQVEVTAEDVAAQGKVLEKALTKEQLVAEFGEAGLTIHADGSWDYNLPTKDGFVPMKTLKRAQEMDRPRQAAERAAGERSAASVPMVAIKNERGERIHVPEHHAERVDRMMFERRRR